MPVNNGTKVKMIIAAVVASAAFAAIGMSPSDTNWGKAPSGSAHAAQAAVVQVSPDDTNWG
jgi:hypothetical protein